jgi:hypothetical protein
MKYFVVLTDIPERERAPKQTHERERERERESKLSA